jgi:hypothetical protein
MEVLIWPRQLFLAQLQKSVGGSFFIGVANGDAIYRTAQVAVLQHLCSPQKRLAIGARLAPIHDRTPDDLPIPRRQWEYLVTVDVYFRRPNICGARGSSDLHRKRQQNCQEEHPSRGTAKQNFFFDGGYVPRDFHRTELQFDSPCNTPGCVLPYPNSTTTPIS